MPYGTCRRLRISPVATIAAGPPPAAATPMAANWAVPA